LLAQIIEILVGQTEPVTHAACNAVSHMLQDGKIIGRNGTAHRQDLDSSFLMNRRSPITTEEASLEPSRKLPETCRSGSEGSDDPDGLALEIQPVADAAFGNNELSPMLAWHASCRRQSTAEIADNLFQLLRRNLLFAFGFRQAIVKQVAIDDAGIMRGLVG